jgi:hypothetical protein
MSKWMKQTIFKEDIHMDLKNKAHEKCSTFLDIKEMWIKTTLEFHRIPVRIATIKNANNKKCWWLCGEKNLSDSACSNVS